MSSLTQINPQAISKIKINYLTEVKPNDCGEPYYIPENTRTKWFGIRKLKHPAQIGYNCWERIDSIKYFTQNLKQYQLKENKVYHSPELVIYLNNGERISKYFITNSELDNFIDKFTQNTQQWISY
jgi:hypothetical protein